MLVAEWGYHLPLVQQRQLHIQTLQVPPHRLIGQVPLLVQMDINWSCYQRTQGHILGSVSAVEALIIKKSLATVFVHCNDNWSQRDVDKNQNEVQVSQKGFCTYSILPRCDQWDPAGSCKTNTIRKSNYTPSRKTKPQECSYLLTILVFHHKPDRTYSSLTVGSSNHWSIYIASAKAESQTMATTRGQTFAVNKFDLHWHKICQRPNYLSMKAIVFH